MLFSLLCSLNGQIRLSWTAGPARLRLSWTLIVFNLSNNLSWITLNKDQLHQSARSSYWFIFLSQLQLTVTLIAFTRTLMCFCECVFCVCWFVSKKNYKTRSEFWFQIQDEGTDGFLIRWRCNNVWISIKNMVCGQFYAPRHSLYRSNRFCIFSIIILCLESVFGDN